MVSVPTGITAEGKLLHVGIEGRFFPTLLDEVVFAPTLSGRLGIVGLEFGGNSVEFQFNETYSLNSQSYLTVINGSLGHYSANVNCYLPANQLIEPHVGAGIFHMGLTGQGEISSGSTSLEGNFSATTGGYNFLFGVDLPLASFGVPIVLTGAINYYRFKDLKVNASIQNTFQETIEEVINYRFNFFYYYFGLRYEF